VGTFGVGLFFCLTSVLLSILVCAATIGDALAAFICSIALDLLFLEVVITVGLASFFGGSTSLSFPLMGILVVSLDSTLTGTATSAALSSLSLVVILTGIAVFVLFEIASSVALLCYP